MNNLKCRKQGFNKMICKRTNKKIHFSDCNNCKYKEYKLSHWSPIKKQTTKQTKAEKNRFSLFTDDLSVCIICGKPKDHLHEVFFGSNRQNSMRYGLVIPVCFKCHRMIHNDSDLQDMWHIRGQKKFEEFYPDLDFLEIFGRNYK